MHQRRSVQARRPKAKAKGLVRQKVSDVYVIDNDRDDVVGAHVMDHADASVFASVDFPGHRGKRGSLASSQPSEDDGFPDNLVPVKQNMVKRGDI